MISDCTKCHAMFNRPASGPRAVCPACARKPGSRALTPSRLSVLAAVESLSRIGYPPTLREVGAATGLSSVSTVKVHIDGLVSSGLAAYDPRRFRTLRLTDAGRKLVEAKG